MKGQWYKHNFLRNLVDMHIPCGDGLLANFDPEAYADNMVTAGFDAVYIYASNCLGLALYPSDIAHRQTEAEKRDIFGETVAACKKRGLTVIGYLNNLEQTSTNFHPDWRTLNSHGSTAGGRYCFPCLNSPFRDYFMSLVREMVSRYDIDGLWVDMIGFWKPVCYCEHCRKAYREATGRELPEVMDYTSKEWVDYLEFKKHVTATYGEDIYNAAKSVKPDISVGLQCASILSGHNVALDNEYFSHTDYCAGDFVAGREKVNTLCRMLYSSTTDMPFEFMTPRCPSLLYHTTFRPNSEIIRQAFAALLYNGSFLLIDAIDPDGGMNADFYRSIREIKDTLAPYITYIDYTETPKRDVAVYMNFDSICDSVKERGVHPEQMGGGANNVRNRLLRFSTIFSRAGMDWALINRKQLGELSKYRLLVVPALDRMADDEVEAIREYVKNGGRLYISERSSLLGTDGTLHGNFMLSDVIGADYDGVYEFEPVYIVPTDDEAKLFGKYNRRYPNLYEGKVNRVSPHADAKLLSTAALPIGDKWDTVNFTSGISSPPHAYLDIPTIIEHDYGDGRVIYSAGILEDSDQRDNQQLLVRLFDRLIGERSVKTKLPECVDYVVWQGENRYRIGLLNAQSECIPPLPIDGIELSIKLDDGMTVGNVYEVGGVPLTWEVCDGWLDLKLGRLEVFQTVIVETTK